MTPTGKSGFRKKNATETRMIARSAFNHVRASVRANFSSQSGLVADMTRDNYRTVGDVVAYYCVMRKLRSS